MLMTNWMAFYHNVFIRLFQMTKWPTRADFWARIPAPQRPLKGRLSSFSLEMEQNVLSNLFVYGRYLRMSANVTIFLFLFQRDLLSFLMIPFYRWMRRSMENVRSVRFLVYLSI